MTIIATTSFSAMTTPNVTGAPRRTSERLAKPRPKSKPGSRDSQATEAEFAMTIDKDCGSKGKERELKGEGPSNQTRKQTQKKLTLDPEEYQHAKEKLKKAVLEHYR